MSSQSLIPTLGNGECKKRFIKVVNHWHSVHLILFHIMSLIFWAYTVLAIERRKYGGKLGSVTTQWKAIQIQWILYCSMLVSFPKYPFAGCWKKSVRTQRCLLTYTWTMIVSSNHLTCLNTRYYIIYGL